MPDRDNAVSGDFEVVFDDDDQGANDAPPSAPGSLGDAGADNSDASYAGDVSTSPVSLDYFRAKYLEFQTTLNALDTAYSAAQVALSTPNVDANTRAGLEGFIQEFQSKKTLLRGTAETLNAGASVANSLGLRMPQLSLPGTLGFAQLTLPVVVVVAVATAATLISWGNSAIENVRVYMTRIQLTPQVQAKIAELESAQAASTGTGLSAMAGGLKWVAIAALAYFAYRAFAGSKHSADD